MEPTDLAGLFKDLLTVSPLAAVLLFIWWDTRKEFRTERDARTAEMKENAKTYTELAIKSANAMEGITDSNDKLAVGISSLAERMSRIEAKVDGK